MAAIQPLFVRAFFIVGLPYLIKTFLGLSAELYSYAEAALGLGSILGGLLSVVMASAGLPAVLSAGGRDRHPSCCPIALALALGLAPSPPTASSSCACWWAWAARRCSASSPSSRFPHPLLGKVSSRLRHLRCAMPKGRPCRRHCFRPPGAASGLVVAFGMAVSLALTAVTGRALGRAVDAFRTETGARAGVTACRAPDGFNLKNHV